MLPKILKCDPCQYFSKYISQLLYCINLTELNSTVYNFFTKPYVPGSIMLASRWELWWKGLFQYQSSKIFLTNREINCFFSYGKPYLFPYIFSHIYNGKSSLKLWAKVTISASIVERAIYIYRFGWHKTGQYENVMT